MGDDFILIHPIYEMEDDRTSHHLPYLTPMKVVGQYNSLEALQAQSMKLYGEKAEEIN